MMNTLRLSVLLSLALVCLPARAGDLYFGGFGDTNTHWVGYRVSATTNAFSWTAYTLDPAKRGSIKIAPATFSAAGTNTWTAVFEEYVLRKNAEVVGLARHDLRIISRRNPQSIQIQDGKDTLKLFKMSPDDLAALKAGRIPNLRGAVNGRLPSSSDVSELAGVPPSPPPSESRFRLQPVRPPSPRR
jgi:hypothetical protein